MFGFWRANFKCVFWGGMGSYVYVLSSFGILVVRGFREYSIGINLGEGSRGYRVNSGELIFRRWEVVGDKIMLVVVIEEEGRFF